MIHVTHDQEEALSIADRVVVMEGGQFRQVGRPIDIYKNPTCNFVADFVGTSNFFEGARTGDVVDTGRQKMRIGQSGYLAGEPVSLAIRPENVEIFKNGAPPQVPEAMNLLPGRIEVVVFQGAAVRVLINMNGEEILSDIIEKEYGQRALKRGDDVYLYFPPEAFLVFPKGEGEK
jgi:ABC-type Fe3+/spermidine/putrescine transport system ATPase subunit